MPRILIAAGVLLVAAGLLWPFLSRLPLGRLPGDILIQRPNFTLYMPITSGLLISLLASCILWLMRR
ncbi:hypothetical protein B0W47_06465 [Komagataeibacter nataicola]|uniref:DUF2905 domain-containing protein n=1 Tax=Komagataeibacter nataicola TaxID=265960 RepID=A0A9N7C708_9PROT|nr:DUF2905 domain-containing protein [Komagataeibacter nataicola]AQU87178.1 hypothetical protein B0W47_06465 [Komagataeibacter nataicola]PYD65709.1 hypothetical protein CDI09_12045 [Komagataeibacter nataicola]WEQ55940.1 DUF2905 domain-containing protein [Komagataeibacter nataicola]WNM07371.1 DUF2905 domain-containing protein [Komagataeibacter nataicola]